MDFLGKIARDGAIFNCPFFLSKNDFFHLKNDVFLNFETPHYNKII